MQHSLVLAALSCPTRTFSFLHPQVLVIWERMWAAHMTRRFEVGDKDCARGRLGQALLSTRPAAHRLK